MNGAEKEIIAKEIRKQVVENFELAAMSDDVLEDRIRTLVKLKYKGSLTIMDQADICDRVFNSIRGLGILDTILKDDNITEVMINGPDEIFVEEKGRIHRLEDRFENEAKLEDIIQRIVGTAGREVNEANPIVDTRLSDGSRVNVVLPPISLKGAIVTIRKFSKEPMTMEKLLEFGSITPEVDLFLKMLVEAKYNIFISGGTGSGKTTFLNALSGYIAHDERVITIEDSAELQLHGIDNLVSLETRNANSSNVGSVTIRDLIRTALRMRPDRIIVGECRGKEALDMLQAMNTGHDGSLSTGHANSVKDMLTRLETMVMEDESNLPLPAVKEQIASAVDIIIHLSRLRDKSRRTMEIAEILDYDRKNDVIHVNPLYEFQEDEDSTLERVSGKLVRTANPMVNDNKLRLMGFKGKL